MRMNHNTRSHCPLISRRRLAMAAAAVCLMGSGARATDYVWTGGSVTSNDWQNPQNWNPNGFPTSTSQVTFPTLGEDYFVFNNSFVSLEASAILFDSTDSLSIGGNQGQADDLILTSGNVARTATSGGLQGLSMNVKMNANGTWAINGTGALDVTSIGETAGSSKSFTKTGTGTLNVQQATYSGTTTVNGGTLAVDAGGLGLGLATVNTGATLSVSGNINHTLALNGAGVGNAGALRVPVGPATWSGPITLSTNSTIGVDNGTLTISGVIDDGINTRNLTKAGAGTLVLSKANTYNGTTTASAGILSITNSSALGTGAVTIISGAALNAADGLTISNNATINGNGPASVGAISNQSGLVTYNGSLTLQSNSSIGSAAGELLVNGPLAGNFVLSKIGAGTVTLTNNGSTGAIAVIQGILKIRNSAAINTQGAVALGAGTVALQETLVGALPINVPRPLLLNSTGDGGNGALRNISGNNTWSGNVTLQTNSQIGVDANQLTISGPISGAFDLTKVGSGTLVLTDPANSYNNTIIANGFLNMSVPAALPAAGSITVQSGGTLQIGGGATGLRPIAINGAGFGGSGALESLAGVNTWSGNISIPTSASIRVDSGELRATAAMSGAGLLEKRGAGKLTLAAANTNTGGFDVFEGVLGVEHSNAFAVGGAANIRFGAALEVKGGISPVGQVTLSDTGILNTGALRNVADSNTWAGAVTLATSNAAIGVDAGSQLSVSGVIGDGANAFPLTKVGAGTLVLSSANTYKGGTFINGGTLSVSADNNLGSAGAPVTTNNGGKLLITSDMGSGRTFNLNTGSLQVSAGVTLGYSHATVNGGFLRGPGTHTIGNNSIFSGVTALNGANIDQSRPTTLVNFTNAGTLNSSADITWDGGFNTSAGIINVSSTFNTQGFENDGTIAVADGATITNTSSSLVSGGGGRISIEKGGTINAGPSFELNGSLLVNNGRVTGTTNVNFGALAKGSGVYDAVNVTDGGKFSPGNSPGTVTTGSTTWNSGGSYLVEIGDALADVGHDLWKVDGQLKLNSTPQHPFLISLASLDDLLFDNSRDYTWPILQADGGILGLDPSLLALDTSAFENDLASGHFSLQSTGSELSIHFSAIPEPAAVISLTVGALFSLAKRRSKP
jgi:autotransporter-associated beta strand protein